MGMAIRRWRQPPKDGFINGGWQSADGGNRRRTVFINGNGNPRMEATAEGRLYNHSPRWLAYLGSVAKDLNLTAEERLYKSRKIILVS